MFRTRLCPFGRSLRGLARATHVRDGPGFEAGRVGPWHARPRARLGSLYDRSRVGRRGRSSSRRSHRHRPPRHRPGPWLRMGRRRRTHRRGGRLGSRRRGARLRRARGPRAQRPVALTAPGRRPPRLGARRAPALLPSQGRGQGGPCGAHGRRSRLHAAGPDQRLRVDPARGGPRLRGPHLRPHQLHRGHAARRRDLR